MRRSSRGSPGGCCWGVSVGNVQLLQDKPQLPKGEPQAHVPRARQAPGKGVAKP